MTHVCPSVHRAAWRIPALCSRARGTQAGHSRGASAETGQPEHSQQQPCLSHRAQHMAHMAGTALAGLCLAHSSVAATAAQALLSTQPVPPKAGPVLPCPALLWPEEAEQGWEKGSADSPFIQKEVLRTSDWDFQFIAGLVLQSCAGKLWWKGSSGFSRGGQSENAKGWLSF